MFLVLLFSNNVSPDHLKICIIPKCNLQKKFCTKLLFTEIAEGGGA